LQFSVDEKRESHGVQAFVFKSIGYKRAAESRLRLVWLSMVISQRELKGLGGTSTEWREQNSRFKRLFKTGVGKVGAGQG
jgi:hypothetical protein